MVYHMVTVTRARSGGLKRKIVIYVLDLAFRQKEGHVNLTRGERYSYALLQQTGDLLPESLLILRHRFPAVRNGHCLN